MLLVVCPSLASRGGTSDAVAHGRNPGREIQDSCTCAGALVRWYAGTLADMGGQGGDI